MRAWLAVAIALTGAFLSGAAAAQYYVGGYYYVCPVGAAWNDPRCVRQPREEEVPPDDAQSAPPYNPPLWGSVYIDHSTGALGGTTQARDAISAETLARQRCEAGGSTHCEKELTFSNQCVAVAWPKGAGRIIVQTGQSIAWASREALPKCGPAGETCEIAYSSCALPN